MAVADLGAHEARSVAPSLDGALGVGVEVSGESSVRETLERCRRTLGRVDSVLDAAGRAEFGVIEDWTLDRWTRMTVLQAGGIFRFTCTCWAR